MSTSLFVAREVDGILRDPVEGGLGETTQHKTGVAAGLAPELRVEILEQGPRGAVPAEEQVAGQLRQARQAGGDDRGDL